MALILVVDDNVLVRRVLREMLERANYEVVEAQDGEAAIRLYEKRPAHVVIMDMLMPDSDGVEAILALRRAYSDVKIIAISGGGRIGPRDYLHLARMSGALRAFTKPLDWDEFLEAVRELTQ